MSPQAGRSQAPPFVEEEVVYPLLRRVGHYGTSVAEARIAEEDVAKDVLSELETLDPAGAEFATRINVLHQAVLRHAENEEREVLPLLRSDRDEDHLQIMAKAFHAAESVAPTHPHPNGPNSATGNMAVGPFVAIVDRVRDAIHSSS